MSPFIETFDFVNLHLEIIQWLEEAFTLRLTKKKKKKDLVAYTNPRSSHNTPLITSRRRLFYSLLFVKFHFECQVGHVLNIFMGDVCVWAVRDSIYYVLYVKTPGLAW